MMHENKIGEIVEGLIRIKDRNKGSLSMEETDFINDACNILYKAFPSQMGAFDAKEKPWCGLALTYDNIAALLKANGIKPTTSAIKEVLSLEGKETARQCAAEELFLNARIQQYKSEKGDAPNE